MVPIVMHGVVWRAGPGFLISTVTAQAQAESVLSTAVRGAGAQLCQCTGSTAVQGAGA